LDETNLQSFRKEVAIMSKLRHPNVLLFMGACMTPGNLMIVTELMSKGSVYDLLRNQSMQKYMTLKLRLKIAKQAALGMNWLHCQKPAFIHRDLKTQNLLVDDHWTVKVCDFGLSHIKKTESEGPSKYGAIGTPLWMAPEVLLNKEYDESADIYSFGIVLWELLTMKDPFPDITSFEALVEQKARQGKRPEIPNETTQEFRQLIESCWQHEPTSRPRFDTIIPQFDQIIIASIVSDKEGRVFWNQYFLNNKSKLHEKIKFKDFVKSFYAFWRQQTPDSEDIKYRALQRLLVGDNQDDLVSIESFGRWLEWFGPMTDITILDRVIDLLKNGWFHGEISSPNAEKLLLKANKKGHFLVRFSSSDPGCYAISVMSKTGKLKHFRVYHKPGLDYLIGNIECKSLEEIIEKHGKELYLRTPCPGSPYEDIFVAKAAPVSVGYIIPDFDS